MVIWGGAKILQGSLFFAINKFITLLLGWNFSILWLCISGILSFLYFWIILCLVQIATLLCRWLSQVWEELTRIQPTDSRPHQRSINDVVMKSLQIDNGDDDGDDGDDGDGDADQ